MDLQYSVENYSSSSHDSPSKRGKKDQKGYMYKKASYEYSNEKNFGDNSDKNIDQLDKLLQDLKNERNQTPDVGTLTSTDITPSSVRILQTNQKNIVENSKIVDKCSINKTFEREPNDVFDTFDGKRNNEWSTENRSSGNIPITEQKFENREVIRSNTGYDSLDSAYIARDIQEARLSNDILPLPGTKVTTTVRTYTYEIPGDTTDLESNRYVLRQNAFNTTQNKEDSYILRSHVKPQSAIPQIVTYNTESYSTQRKYDQKPMVVHDVFELSEDVKKSSVLQNNLPVKPFNSNSEFSHNINESASNKLTNIEYLDSRKNTTFNRSPSPSMAYKPGPTTSSYFYHESNVTNTTLNPESVYRNPNERPTKSPNEFTNIVIHPSETVPSSSKFSSYSQTTNTHTNNIHPYPQTKPAPFPISDVSFPDTKDNPPQKVDELMKHFESSNVVNQNDAQIQHRKREVETSVALPNQHKPLSVNKAGKDVYYPPGHDKMLTLHGEEMHSGSAAGGRWAKGSGMYEYESGYKSKSKSKSGGAIVPVCLPLCCAMPCSIM